MKSILVRDIVIKFSDDEEELAKHVEVVIKNNYNMFASILSDSKELSLVPTNGGVYVDDFDMFFKDIIIKALNSDEVVNLLLQDNLLKNLYCEYFIDNNYKGLKLDVISKLDYELFYFVVGCKYYNENGIFDDFVNFLMNRNDLDKLIEWLKDKVCFSLYNDFLLEIVNFFKRNDKNLLFLKSIRNMDFFREDVVRESKKRDNKVFDNRDIDNMFYEFLEFIGAPIGWKNMYRDFRLEGRINFNSDRFCCVRDNDKTYINSNINNDIELVFSSLVHEFIHCLVEVSNTNNKDVNTSINEYFLLSEIPSIFFERCVVKFLSDRGYFVDDIINIRILDNCAIMKKLTGIFIDIDIFYKNGFISFEKKVDSYLKNEDDRMEIFNLAKEVGIGNEKLLQSILSLDINDIVKKECGKFVDKFLREGLFVIDGYQYLIATFINDLIDIKYGSDNMDISNMIYVINNIYNLDLDKILDVLDIRDIFLEVSSKNKVVSRVKKN